MSVRQASKRAYHSKSGKKRQNVGRMKVSSYMARILTPKTRKEIGAATGLPPNEYSARCYELVAAKVLCVVGYKKCSISGKTVGALIHSANKKR